MRLLLAFFLFNVVALRSSHPIELPWASEMPRTQAVPGAAPAAFLKWVQLLLLVPCTLGLILGWFVWHPDRTRKGWQTWYEAVRIEVPMSNVVLEQ